jgi:diguanylate cyclase (GGDEF)-like protein/PAS domain S-box-containing protein
MIASRPKILAVDDHPQNLVTLASALEAEFDFQLVASGPEAVELAKLTPPDLILLDVMMPGVDGFETCRRFKDDAQLKGIPLIFLTALSDLETEVSGLALGAADYITKPINIELVRQRMRNLLQLTRVTRELKESEQRLRLVMDATGEGIWDWEIQSGTVVHNAAWCRILGMDETYLSHPLEIFAQRIHPEDWPVVEAALNACLAGGESYRSEHRMRTNAGDYIWILDRGQVVERSADGVPLRMVGSIANIDLRKCQEAEIHRLAFFDPLTELPNRRLLIDRLQQSILKSRRRHVFGALMFLDLDRFKLLNDTYGHAMGDALLIQVASRLKSCLREQDTVARLGGDEFVIMLENLSDAAEASNRDALMVANKILEALNQPYKLGAMSYSSTPSIGLTLFSGHDDSLDAVLKRADEAMYEAKAAGRNTFRIAV